MAKYDYLEIGVHLHSRPEQAADKILAAYDAGCRRFDSALGGLGGCPFAQDALVGNIPTETSDRGTSPTWRRIASAEVARYSLLKATSRHQRRSFPIRTPRINDSHWLLRFQDMMLP